MVLFLVCMCYYELICSINWPTWNLVPVRLLANSPLTIFSMDSVSLRTGHGPNWYHQSTSHGPIWYCHMTCHGPTQHAQPTSHGPTWLLQPTSQGPTRLLQPTCHGPTRHPRLTSHGPIRDFQPTGHRPTQCLWPMHHGLNRSPQQTYPHTGTGPPNSLEWQAMGPPDTLTQCTMGQADSLIWPKLWAHSTTLTALLHWALLFISLIFSHGPASGLLDNISFIAQRLTDGIREKWLYGLISLSFPFQCSDLWSKLLLYKLL